MKVVIVEDEILSAQRLEKLLLPMDLSVEVMAMLDSVKSSVQWLQTNPAPDLIFLDIHLGDGLSFEILEQINIECPIIFTTAYDEYAIKAFKFNSIDYLLKPIETDLLEKAIQKFRKITSPPVHKEFDFKDFARLLTTEKKIYRSRFLVNYRDELLPISTPEIAYFYSENKNSYLMGNNGSKYLIDYTLEELESELDPAHFFRITRQIIASSPSIKKIYQHFNLKLKVELVPQFHEEIMLSRDKSGLLKEWLNR